ncbi:MAG: hypothetical protein PF481_09565 [Bacteroidales bacterium]|jgi:hypothetical protein|nr:hypothetical protein [Bacteroidales bacterium]
MVSLQTRNFSDIVAYLIFVMAGCLAFWDLISGTHMLSWDMIDGNYPFQHLQSLIERNGNIPLWDPYTNFGTPLHSKLGQWYPIRFISAKIGEYTAYKLNIEFVLHIILAGMGMFALLRSRSFSSGVALFAGIAYMFSGFFIGNAQHMSWIISGAWLPWLLLVYLNLLRSPSLRHIPISIFIFFCFFSGGYPAFSIVTVYLLFFGTIAFSIHAVRTNKQKNLRKTTIYLIAIITGVTILSLAYLSSFFTMLSSVTRGDGVSMTAALYSSVRAFHTITFIAPFTNAFSQENFWDGDLSMLNMYIGIATLLLSLYSLRFIRNTKVFFAWIGVVFFASLSVGDSMPVRSFFYNYVPLWDSFRFPALFRLYYIFLLIGLAAFAFEKMKHSLTIKTLFRISLILIVTYSIVVGMTYILSPDFPNYIYWHNFLRSLHFSHTILIQASIQLMILLGITGISYIIYKKNQKISVSSIIIAYLICDMVSTTALQSAITVTTPIETYYTQSHVDVLPKQTAWPNINEQAYDNSAKSLSIAPPLWRNLHLFHKKRAYNGYTSYVLKSTEKFEKSILYDSVKTYPVFYTPQKVYSEKDTNIDYSSGHIAVLPDSLLNNSYRCDSSSLTLISGNQNECILSAYCTDTTYLICMQNKYTGWEATINGQKTQILPANYMAMAVIIPPGTSTIQLSYKPSSIVEAYYLYETILYILIVLIIFTALSKSTSRRKKIGIIGLTCLSLLYIEIRNKYGIQEPESKETLSYTERKSEKVFTSQAEEYTEQKNKIDTDTCTYFSKEMMYGSTFSFAKSHLAHILSSYKNLHISLSVLPETNIENVYIAINIYKNKHQFDFKSFPIANFIDTETEWNFIETTVPLHLKASDNYAIRIFLYSPEKKSFFYKNFTISFFN